MTTTDSAYVPIVTGPHGGPVFVPEGGPEAQRRRNLRGAFRYYLKAAPRGYVPEDFRGRRAVYAIDKARAALDAIDAAEARRAAAHGRLSAAFEEATAAGRRYPYSPEWKAAREELEREERKARQARRPINAAGTWRGGRPGSWGRDESRGLFFLEEEEGGGLFRFVGRVQPQESRPSGLWDSRGDCGWITDPSGDVFKDGTGLCFGVVFQLAGRDGKARFVAGYQFGGQCGGPALDLRTIYESESRDEWNTNQREQEAAEEAARAADSMAKAAAEEEREYQTAWQAGAAWQSKEEERESLKEEAAEARRQILAILKERRAAMTNPAITDAGFFALCDAIRGRVRGLVADIQAARERRAELAEEQAELAAGDAEELCFWPGDKRLAAAFCEAAGLQDMPL